jgi:hypothetical protein
MSKEKYSDRDLLQDIFDQTKWNNEDDEGNENEIDNEEKQIDSPMDPLEEICKDLGISEDDLCWTIKDWIIWNVEDLLDLLWEWDSELSEEELLEKLHNTKNKSLKK